MRQYPPHFESIFQSGTNLCRRFPLSIPYNVFLFPYVVTVAIVSSYEKRLILQKRDICNKPVKSRESHRPRSSTENFNLHKTDQNVTTCPRRTKKAWISRHSKFAITINECLAPIINEFIMANRAMNSEHQKYTVFALSLKLSTTSTAGSTIGQEISEIARALEFSSFEFASLEF